MTPEPLLSYVLIETVDRDISIPEAYSTLEEAQAAMARYFEEACDINPKDAKGGDDENRTYFGSTIAYCQNRNHDNCDWKIFAVDKNANMYAIVDGPEESPRMDPREKAIRDMAKDLKEKTVPLELFGKEVPMIEASAIDSYVQKHMHDFYDYDSMEQPYTCIHDGVSACCYPISDCPNCPVALGEMPGTTCRIM